MLLRADDIAEGAVECERQPPPALADYFKEQDKEQCRAEHGQRWLGAELQNSHRHPQRAEVNQLAQHLLPVRK